MPDIFSKEWLGDLQEWGTTVLEKGVETLLFGKKTAAAGTAAPVAQGTSSAMLKKWLPYALIGGALVVVLLVFKGKK